MYDFRDDREEWFGFLRDRLDERPRDERQVDILTHLGLREVAEACFMVKMGAYTAYTLLDNGWRGPVATEEDMRQILEILEEAGEDFMDIREDAVYGLLRRKNVILKAVAGIYMSPSDLDYIAADWIAGSTSDLVEEDIEALCMRPWCPAHKGYCPHVK